jgi:hypothetical protein
MTAAIIILIVALLFLVGTFSRLVALRRKWRNEPPPKYRRPYQRWKDEKDEDEDR